MHVRPGSPTRSTISPCCTGSPNTSGGRSSTGQDVIVWMGDRQVVRPAPRIYLEHPAVADGDGVGATDCRSACPGWRGASRAGGRTRQPYRVTRYLSLAVQQKASRSARWRRRRPVEPSAASAHPGAVRTAGG